MPTTAAERLTDAGLRATKQRLAVLEAISPGEHLDVDTVAERARAELGSLSTQAVYDALRALDSAGLVRRLQPARAPALYEIRVGDSHHHLTCRSCGTVIDIEKAIGEVPCLDPTLPAGFVIEAAEVTWWGYCVDCAR
jgi:Fur family transcriptional regulator, stress-responsive regulator